MDVMTHAFQSDQQIIDTLLEKDIRIRRHRILSVAASTGVHHTPKANDNSVPASLNKSSKTRPSRY